MNRQLARLPLGAVVGALLALSVTLASAQGGDLTVTQASVGGSGVTATATLTAAGNQTTVAVSARGLTPGSTNENEIHFGTCANTGGIAFTLPSLVAGANGTAAATTTINATLASLQDGNHEMHIHMTNAAGTILSCGDIPVAVAAATTTTTAATTATTAVATTTTSAAVSTTSSTVAAASTTAAALPATGGFPLPTIPAGLFGGAMFSLGMYLRRHRAA